MVSEDRLVVCQPDMEQMFSVYRLPDIDYLYSFGRKGQGPDEFATIYFKRIVPTDEGFKLCCNDRRIYHVSLDDGSVQVWRWDGAPVASYWLDHRISSFALSERTGKIYAVSTDEGAADQIFVYDLPYY